MVETTIIPTGSGLLAIQTGLWSFLARNSPKLDKKKSGKTHWSLIEYFAERWQFDAWLMALFRGWNLNHRTWWENMKWMMDILIHGCFHITGCVSPNAGQINCDHGNPEYSRSPSESRYSNGILWQNQTAIYWQQSIRILWCQVSPHQYMQLTSVNHILPSQIINLNIIEYNWIYIYIYYDMKHIIL